MLTEVSKLTELVKQFEGCRLKAYLCPAGVWTIGWGSTGKGINYGSIWTQEQADKRLEQDCKAILTLVSYYTRGLSGNPLVAASSFTYNLGIGKYRASTFRRRLLEGNMEAAKVQLMRWTRANGKVLKGLVRRRQAEMELIGN